MSENETTNETRHAVKALKLLSNAKSAENAKQAELLIADAQVHATLALAQQQRISNLIALGEATFPDGSRVYSRAVVEPGEHIESYRLRDEVREGLGL